MLNNVVCVKYSHNYLNIITTMLFQEFNGWVVSHLSDNSTSLLGKL